MADAVCLVTTTVGTAADAARLAEILVAERLAACVQVHGPLRSTYRWEGAVAQADEWSVSAKTTAPRLSALRERLAALHPYALPEWLVTPVLDQAGPYCDWVRAEVTPAG